MGIEEQTLEVDEDFRSGVTSVRKRIEELMGGNVLYAVAYNGTIIALVTPFTRQYSGR